jgi:tellurite resistance protein TerC
LGIPVGVSLAVVALVLGASVGASLLWPKAAQRHDPVVHDPLGPGSGDRVPSLDRPP